MSDKVNPLVLDPEKEARRLYDCKIQNEAQGIQVNMFKTHFPCAEQHKGGACKEAKITELSTRLEAETKENKFLWKQVGHLTNELQNEKVRNLKLSDQLQQERDTHQGLLDKEMKSHAERMSKDQEMLNKLRAEQEALRQTMDQQLKNLKTRLEEQTSTNLELATQLQAEKEASQALQVENAQLLEAETKENKLLWKQVEHLTNELQNEKARELKLSDQLQQERDTHQGLLEREMKSHAERMSEDQEMLNKLRAEQEALRQTMEQQLENLKTRFEEQTSTNLELATQLQAEKEASQSLQTENAQLKEKLKEQEDKALAAIMAVEMLVEEEVSEEKIPERKKRRSVWKRIRHFFGLRRRKQDKRENESTNN